MARLPATQMAKPARPGRMLRSSQPEALPLPTTTAQMRSGRGVAPPRLTSGTPGLAGGHATASAAHKRQTWSARRRRSLAEALTLHGPAYNCPNKFWPGRGGMPPRLTSRKWQTGFGRGARHRGAQSGYSWPNGALNSSPSWPNEVAILALSRGDNGVQGPKELPYAQVAALLGDDPGLSNGEGSCTGRTDERFHVLHELLWGRGDVPGSGRPGRRFLRCLRLPLLRLGSSRRGRHGGDARVPAEPAKPPETVGHEACACCSRAFVAGGSATTAHFVARTSRRQRRCLAAGPSLQEPRRRRDNGPPTQLGR